MEKKSMFKNSIYKSILSLVNIVVPMIIGPYIARLLDMNLYGIYNKVYAEFQVFLIFASFGIYTFGIREISKVRENKEKVNKLITNLFVLGIISNVLVGIVYTLYALFTSEGITTAIYLVMLIQIVGNIFYIEFMNEALENYKFITIKSGIIKVLYLFALLIFVRKPTDIIPYAIVISLVNFFNNFISFIYLKKYIKFDFKNIKIKKYIKPLFLILIISNIDVLFAQLDRIMLGKFTSEVAVTMYYMPYYLVSTLAAIPYSVIWVSIPRMAYIVENEGKKEYQKVLKKSISALYFIILPMCLGLFVISDEIMLLYAGEKYIETGIVLALAAIMRIVISTESIHTNLIMYPNGKEKMLSKFLFSCGIINLILNFVLVYFKILTPFTSMFTTMIAETILVTIQMIYTKNVLKIKTNLFCKENMRYLLLSLMFVPIAIGFKLIDMNVWIRMILIMISCFTLYVGVLAYKKDENLALIIDRVFKRGK